MIARNSRGELVPYYDTQPVEESGCNGVVYRCNQDPACRAYIRGIVCTMF